MASEAYYSPQTSVIMYSPEHAQALGNLMAEWAIAEDALASCLQWLLNMEHEPSVTLYQSFVSTRAKIDLLIRLNRDLTQEAADKQEIADFLKEAVSLNAMRNAYVHAKWTRNDNHPGELQRISQTLPQANDKRTEYERVWLSAKQIVEDVARVAKWHQALGSCLYRIDPLRLNKAPRSP